MSSRPVVGIRHEDKSPWERRAPLGPEHVRSLVAEHGIDVVVQSSPMRVFDDDAYRQAGARIAGDLAGCPLVLGVKEIPAARIVAGTAYMYFAHVTKGQPQNMAMLRALLDRGCHLIDYERVVDERRRRLIFFGRFAGLAGMIDTLWALGQRLRTSGIQTPLAELRRAHDYADLSAAKEQVHAVGERLAAEGIPAELRPLTIGLAGYGNVSQGAQEIVDELPSAACSPQQLLAGDLATLGPDRHVIKVVFTEQDMVEPLDLGRPFALQDYYDHPERYRGAFARYLPKLTVLVNCIYWDRSYPRLVTRADVSRLYAAGGAALRVIGDISCDVQGAVEITAKTTSLDQPVFVYEPERDAVRDGLDGSGPVVMAVDNLPAALPADATRSFGDVLAPFVPTVARADFALSREALGLPAELSRGLVVHRGELTPDFAYLKEIIGTQR
ncbi:MAG: hypothetical protein HY744_02665 [Deltaproteobacteria bacterium]|nr:hypothetical protein [Deltaproteobacteria bacterium]